MTTVGQLLAAAVAVDPTRPLLTWYDDGTGERTELSGATLANWVAKTANLLVDGAGTQPGDRTVVLLPPHWQTAAVLLGAWSAGLEVATAAGPGEVGLATPVRAVPRTLSAKKLEVPVKRILTGTPVERAAATGALANPESLHAFEEFAATRRESG